MPMAAPSFSSGRQKLSVPMTSDVPPGLAERRGPLERQPARVRGRAPPVRGLQHQRGRGEEIPGGRVRCVDAAAGGSAE